MAGIYTVFSTCQIQVLIWFRFFGWVGLGWLVVVFVGFLLLLLLSLL